MAFDPFIDDGNHSKTYDGINIAIGSIFVAMKCRPRLKGWERAIVAYDTEKQAISLKKAKKGEGYAVGYGIISSRVYRVMPTGRYIFSEVKDGALIFVKQ